MTEKKAYAKPVGMKCLAANVISGSGSSGTSGSSSKSCGMYRRKSNAYGGVYYH
jgi:hypothetical protein